MNFGEYVIDICPLLSKMTIKKKQYNQIIRCWNLFKPFDHFNNHMKELIKSINGDKAE